MRRLRRYFAGHHDVLTMVQWREHDLIRLPDFPELPPGARVAEVYYSRSRRAFCFVVEHPSFELVDLGCEVPAVDGVLGLACISVNTEAWKLRELLEGCKKGSCWCPAGIGRPGFSTHTAHCLAVQEEMGQGRGSRAEAQGRREEGNE